MEYREGERNYLRSGTNWGDPRPTCGGKSALAVSFQLPNGKWSQRGRGKPTAQPEWGAEHNLPHAGEATQQGEAEGSSEMRLLKSMDWDMGAQNDPQSGDISHKKRKNNWKRMGRKTKTVSKRGKCNVVNKCKVIKSARNFGRQIYTKC